MQCASSGEREQSIDAERLFEIFHRSVRPMVVRGNGFGHTHTDSNKDIYVFFFYFCGTNVYVVNKGVRSYIQGIARVYSKIQRI